MVALRITVSAKAEGKATPRVRDRSAASFREEEEAAEMENLRQRRQAAFQEAAGRARITLRTIAAVRALARAADVISAVVSATAEQLADREVDSETADRARASLLRLRKRIQKSCVMTKRGAQAIRKEISALVRIIFTRRMRRSGIVRADLSSLNRRRRKLLKRRSR